MSMKNIQITEQSVAINETQKTLSLVWTLDSSATEAVVRYCSHCGKVVNFKDSGVRRQNSNGKNIFHFAIYKCEKDHTWNKKLEQFTARSHLTNVPIHNEKNHDFLNYEEDDLTFNNEVKSDLATADYNSLCLKTIQSKGIERIQIQVLVSGGKHRLDKVLSEKLKSVSRSQLVKHMASGHIALDGVPAKGKALLKSQQVIDIDLKSLNV